MFGIKLVSSKTREHDENILLMIGYDKCHSGGKNHGPTGTRAQSSPTLEYQRTTMLLGSSVCSVRTVSERPWVRVLLDFFIPCDIWWLSVGSRLGQRASNSACFVVPPLLRAESETNLNKQGEKFKDDHVAL